MEEKNMDEWEYEDNSKSSLRKGQQKQPFLMPQILIFS